MVDKNMKTSSVIPPILAALGVFGLIALLLCGCGSHPAAQQNPGASPGSTGAAWVSDAALSSQLGPEEQIGGYGIRPPAGYTEKRFVTSYPNPTGLQIDWTGPPGTGGITPYMELDVDTDSSRSSSDDEVRMDFDVATQDHTGVVPSQIAQGTINGLGFSRGYWKGAGRATGRQFHGLVYGRAAPTGPITVLARDGEPTYQQSLPLMEASVLTLRKL